MVEHLVTSETSIIAEQKGFRSLTIPTQSLLQKWLRETYGIDISIDVVDNSREGYYELVWMKNDIRDYNDEECFDSVRRFYHKGKFRTYEEALEEGLIQGLKLI